ncbi:MAG: hypothetical protein AAGJ35_15385, partial [Myxococcota bacterium]
KFVTGVFVAPGNAGTAQVAVNVPLSVNDFSAIENWVVDNDIGLVVVGPEDPLVNGIVDHFRSSDSLRDVNVVGPSQEASQLEGSKDFAKAFMQKYDIPTADYRTFDLAQLEEAYEFLDTLHPPYVLKADGLAAGKGVLIIDNLNDAKQELKEMLQDAKFGRASTKVVIEEAKGENLKPDRRFRGRNRRRFRVRSRHVDDPQRLVQ